MATHNVYFSLPRREVGNSDIVIDIHQDDEKFGTITISKGALQWYPANAKNPYDMGWARFDRAIKSYYRRTKRKRKL